MSQVSLSNSGAASGQQRRSAVLGKSAQDMSDAMRQMGAEGNKALDKGLPLIPRKPTEPTAVADNSINLLK